MAFKDKLIENLQYELDELMECRHRTSRNNLELVDKTLSIPFIYVYTLYGF